jgi:hypothetical protein
MEGIKRHFLKRKHLRDEKQSTPNAHDDIRAKADEKTVANLNPPPCQEKRQKNENGDRRMDGNPKILKRYSSTGLYNPEFRSREFQAEEFWGGVGGNSGIGVMILSGWVGIWSVTDHSNCAAIGSPSETVCNRRKNSGRSCCGIAKRT